MVRKKITIDIEENIDYRLADILCWLRGYLSGKNEEYSQDEKLLNPAIESLHELNCKLKQALLKEKK